MQNHLKNYNADQRIQSREDQVKNNAGGYVYKVTPLMAVERFLVLGTEGGTYYASQSELTVTAARTCLEAIKQDGIAVVDKIVDISVGGKAPKQDPALFLLAMASGMGDLETRQHALVALQAVARTATHLFIFLEYVKQFRGWGRGLKTAIDNWYADKSVNQVAYQMVKYRQRNGWTHRDVLRKAHPVADSKVRASLYNWACRKELDVYTPQLVKDFAALQACNSVSTAVELLQGNKSLTWEAVPTEMLKSPSVWSVLLPNMPLMAMVRNLGRLSSLGLLTPFSEATDMVVSKLGDTEYLKRSRIHPVSLYNATRTYAQGCGVKGSLTWNAEPAIVAALEDAFYNSFDNIEPTGKRFLIALDVSGSMGWDSIAGMSISAREASAILALTTIKAEKYTHVTAFTRELTPLAITKNDNFNSALNKVSRLPFGSTDCSQPMIYAIENKIPVDVFVVYTDNETWAGYTKPSDTLQEYRNKMGIDAKLVVVGMTATDFTIADPLDPGMLDVVGFNTSTPQAISNFSVI